MNNEEQKLLYRKERILNACKMIKNCSKEALSIIQSSTISNIRSIERNSRSIKDPNPLMTTLTNINLKYPLTLIPDRIPTDFIFPGDMVSRRMDNRRFKRRLCKLSTVQYWTANSPQPSDHDTTLIDGIIKQSIKKYELINNFKWADTRFLFGTVNYTRNSVPTNPYHVEIPKELRMPAINIILDIANYVDYVEVPTHYLEQLRKIVNDSAINLRSVPNILHFLQSQLDPKVRVIPVLHGIDSQMVPILHAIVQPNYRTIDSGRRLETKIGHNQIITELCIALLFHIQDKKISYASLKHLTESCRIYGFPVNQLLIDTEENKFTRFVKGAIGLDINPCIIKGPYTFFPLPNKNIREDFETNKKGHQFRIYRGVEEVFFESSHTKGFFTHSGDLIETITTIKTNKKILIESLIEIALFCKKEFSNTGGRYETMMRNEASKKFQKDPHSTIDFTKNDFKELLRSLDQDGPTTIRHIRLVPRVELVPPPPMTCLLRGENLVDMGGQIMCTAPKTNEKPVLSKSISISDHSIFYLLHPVKLLKKASLINFENINTIKRNISLEVFKPPYPQILEMVPVVYRKHVSNYIKHLLIQQPKLEYDIHFISIFYNFTHTSTGKPTNQIINNFNFSDGTVNTTMNRGLIKRDVNKRTITIDDEITFNLDGGNLLGSSRFSGLIPGFILQRVPYPVKGIETKNIKWIRENKHRIPEGKIFNTIFQTNHFTATKNSNIDLQTQQTISRYILIKENEDPTTIFRAALKRHRVEASENTSSSSTSEESKRRRIDSASVLR